MAFTRVNPGDPIQAHQLDQVVDALNGTASAGQPVALTSLNDATNYALTVQNDEATNSRALNVLKSDGTTLIKADVTGVTLGSPLNLPTNSITSTYIADGTIQNIDLGPDVPRAQLLTNGGFEIWQRGNGPFTGPGVFSTDRWSNAIGGTDTMSVSRDTANVDASSLACAAVTFTKGSGSGTALQQSLADQLGQLGGRTISVSIRVKTSTANAVRIRFFDGTTISNSSYHTGNGAYQTLALTVTLPSNPTAIFAGVQFDASCTAYLDNAMLVVGSQATDYVPLHPADDLARCLRYYEAITGNAQVGAGQCASATGAYIPVQFKAYKCVTPTVTFSSPGDFIVTNAGAGAVTCTNLVASSQTGGACQIVVTVAGGLVAGNATWMQTNANARLAIEANP